jgi:hypothetical protein
VIGDDLKDLATAASAFPEPPVKEPHASNAQFRFGKSEKKMLGGGASDCRRQAEN